jgi:hypothetical protein
MNGILKQRGKEREQTVNGWEWLPRVRGRRDGPHNTENISMPLSKWPMYAELDDCSLRTVEL